MLRTKHSVNATTAPSSVARCRIARCARDPGFYVQARRAVKARTSGRSPRAIPDRRHLLAIYPSVALASVLRYVLLMPWSLDLESNIDAWDGPPVGGGSRAAPGPMPTPTIRVSLSGRVPVIGDAQEAATALSKRDIEVSPDGNHIKVTVRLRGLIRDRVRRTPAEHLTEVLRRRLHELGRSASAEE